MTGSSSSVCFVPESTSAMSVSRLRKCQLPRRKNVSGKQDVLSCVSEPVTDSACRVFVNCVICGEKHQNLLRPSLPSLREVKSVVFEDSTEDNREKSSTTCSCVASGREQVFIQTAMVKLKNGNKQKTVRALFDTGSQRSHILTSTAAELGYQTTGSETITHVLFGGWRRRISNTTSLR